MICWKEHSYHKSEMNGSCGLSKAGLLPFFSKATLFFVLSFSEQMKSYAKDQGFAVINYQL